MIHKHEFVTVKEIDRPAPHTSGWNSTQSGVKIACASPDCHEVRKVWETGDVEIWREGLPDKE